MHVPLVWCLTVLVPAITALLVNFFNSGSCVLAPIGSYSTGGSSSCNGPTSCTGCLTTTATGSTSVSACVSTPTSTSCLAGYYFSKTTNACVLASIGFYATAGQCEQAQCTGCATTSAIGATSSSSCTPCPAGRYLSSNGVCVLASIGFYVTAGTCVHAQCTGCATTSNTGATSSSSCTPCPAGRYLSSNGVCVLASIGFYVTAGTCVQSPCGPCTTTTAIGATISTQCAGCPAGKYLSSNGVCVNAGTGYWASANSCSPTLCGACKTTPTATATSASECSSVQSCPPGQYFKEASGMCVNAGSGYYSSGGSICNASQCPPCTSTFALQTATSDNQCTFCPAGKYYSNGACKNAGVNYWAPGGTCSATACEACKTTGTNALATSASQCGQVPSCPPGQYYSESAKSCTQASIGYWSAGGILCNAKQCGSCLTTAGPGASSIDACQKASTCNQGVT